jgi:L-ascorbate metabolism protein UlaG (beta-lactamase superfamily)
MLGFETIGNATVIAYDGASILATDPWMGEPAYFGSWGLPFEIPDQQKEAILAAEFIWLSHGHPDHLNPQALEKLHGKKILLPNHIGGRIRDDLRGAGFDVTVLADNTWTGLSEIFSCSASRIISRMRCS